jgi:hypothetical protein
MVDQAGFEPAASGVWDRRSGLAELLIGMPTLGAPTRIRTPIPCSVGTCPVRWTMDAWKPYPVLTRGPRACYARALPLSYTAGAVLAGLEPAISTLTEWRGLQLPYKTLIPVAATAGDARPLRLAVAGAACVRPSALHQPRRSQAPEIGLEPIQIRLTAGRSAN